MQFEKQKWNVIEFGAVGDGIEKSTASIQKCIDACSNAGGGVVYLEQGVYVCGTIILKSNVTLELAETATLLASPDITDYRTDTHHNRYRNEPELDRCFLFAEGQENIRLTGYGTIKGNAAAFPNEGSSDRPMMMRFLECSNIRIENLRLLDAAAWTTAFLDSTHIWVSGVTIYNDKNYNGDGLDFDGCSHVFVSNCSITGTDDNLCLQAGNKEYPVEDIHITNCEFSSICAAVRIGLKSIGVIRNVVIENCTMNNVWREGIKIECTEGGSITDISVHQIIMHNVRRPLFVLLNNRFLPEGLGSSIELERMPQIGKLKRLIFSNIIVTDDCRMEQTQYRFQTDIMGEPKFNGIRFDAEEKHPIEQVTLRDCYYTCIGGVKKEEIPDEYPKVLDKLLYPKATVSENYYPDWSRTTFLDMRNIRGLSLCNVCLKAIKKDERPPFLLENCEIYKQEIFLRD